MRYQLLVAFVILGGLAASPVSARYGYCEAYKKNAASFGPADSQYPLMLSGILDFGEKRENYAESEKQFRVFLFNNSVTCDSSYKTVRDAAAAKRRRIEFSRGADTDTGWTGSFAAHANTESTSESTGATAARAPNEVSISFGGSSTKGRVERPVPTKYVEVQGPNGPMRLSSEVAARNEAAADEYRRKMEAHARDKADHDRKMTEYQESRARAGRALGDHAAQLRAQQEEHQRQIREHAARVEGRGSNSPCARYRASKGVGWKVNPCV